MAEPELPTYGKVAMLYITCNVARIAVAEAAANSARGFPLCSPIIVPLVPRSVGLSPSPKDLTFGLGSHNTAENLRWSPEHTILSPRVTGHYISLWFECAVEVARLFSTAHTHHRQRWLLCWEFALPPDLTTGCLVRLSFSCGKTLVRPPTPTLSLSRGRVKGNAFPITASGSQS